MIETYRDLASGMLDVYLSSTSNRLNEVMKVLTIISTIFIPLNFIAGVYGMNFNSPRQAHSTCAGYVYCLGLWRDPAVLTLMAVSRRKCWSSISSGRACSDLKPKNRARSSAS